MFFRLIIATILLSANSLSLAAADAVVEGIQLPAWVTREGKRQPLAIGAALKTRDEVSTGANSRLLLRLGDGSRVKLGENGSLQISGLVQRRGENLLTATLKVIEGAFRFTTEAALRGRSRRDITVQFPTVTAGIRGTDIWGKNLGDKEVVVLIEGRITVTRGSDAPLEMKDPLTYLQAPRGAATSVQAVPAEQLEAWAAETEIAAGQGAVRQGGRWKLFLSDSGKQGEALALYDRLRGDGYPVRIVPRQTADGQRFRIRLAGFPNQKEALALGDRLRKMYPALNPLAAK